MSKLVSAMVEFQRDLSPAQGKSLAEMIGMVIHEERERCAKAVCSLCRGGYPVKKEDGYWQHISISDDCLIDECKAHNIWDLEA